MLVVVSAKCCTPRDKAEKASLVVSWWSPWGGCPGGLLVVSWLSCSFIVVVVVVLLVVLMVVGCHGWHDPCVGVSPSVFLVFSGFVPTQRWTCLGDLRKIRHLPVKSFSGNPQISYFSMADRRMTSARALATLHRFPGAFLVVSWYLLVGSWWSLGSPYGLLVVSSWSPRGLLVVVLVLVLVS